MVRFYLGEEPLLPSVPTYDLGSSRTMLERALDRLDELVIKPRGGYGGHGVVVLPARRRADDPRARPRRGARGARATTSPRDGRCSRATRR